MLKNLKICFMITVSLFIFVNGAQAMATLSSSQVEPGMKGYAKTVIEGDRIDSFSVEIIGVMKDDSDTEGKIIARVSGDLVEKTGGVLQGMSGSPVYIDGKLVGAISGGWKDIDNRTCLITPINDMLKVWNLPDEKNKLPKRKFNFGKTPDKKTDVKFDQKVNEKETEKKSSATDTKTVAKPEKKNKPLQGKAEVLATPLMVSGFGEAGMKILEEKLQPLSLVPYMAGNGGNQGKKVELEPGSSVGVQLVRGDITMAAIGTVTAVEDGKIIAFGHPFLRKGNVNYFMTDAQIIATASGVTSGFKVGVPGNLVGRISQDRSAAVAGAIGRYPSVVPLRVTVEDAQLQSKKTYNMQVAYDEELMASLIPTMVYNAMDKARDRIGYGTAQVSFEIMTDSVSSGKFKRDNMFYHVQDVGQVAVTELLQTLNLLATNDTGESDIFAVKVDVKLDESKKTASLVEVTPNQVSVKAGETLNLRIKLKPYRKDEEVIVVPYKVPQNQKAGMMNLEVRGGGLVPIMQILMQQQGLDLTSQEEKFKPFGVKLEELANSNKNNEIIIGPSPVMPGMAEPPAVKPEKTPKKIDRTSDKKTNTGTAQTVVDPVVKHGVEYIVDNVLQVSVMVEAAAKNK